MKRYVIGLLAVIVLTACGSGSSESIQGEWKLVSHGSGSNQISAVADVGTSIEFDAEGRMSGNVGCNNFGGNYTVDGDTIKFSPIMSTEMFCEGPIGGQESAVLSVLQETTSFVINGNMMTITSSNGDASIVLERQ